jgi:hypothetical protein
MCVPNISKESEKVMGLVRCSGRSSGAREEVARAKKEGINIILVTVQDILDEKFSLLPSSESERPVKKKGRRKSGTTISQPHLFHKGE